MSEKPETNQSITSEIRSAKQGKIGVITLNSPKSLNSLTLDMVKIMRAELEAWRNNDDIALVILKGAGEKAFCAGGDVQMLYQSATEQAGGPCEYAEDFFLQEYQLNYLIHTYRKPVLCLGRGIVMGGGLGLMAGASHRVATETTRIAMPEITIGLFPDVGGTWFLNKMRDGLGNFFALSGASINALDAKFTGLADLIVRNDALADLQTNLENTAWQPTAEDNHSVLSDLLKEAACSESFVSQYAPRELQPLLRKISAACQKTSLGEIISALKAIESDSKWYLKALHTMTQGSPLSSLLIYEQLKRYRYADLKQVFQQELVLATNIVRYPEFTEGVRALLIDKDKQPRWKYSHFSAVPAAVMETFFQNPWPENPLLSALQAIDEQQ